MRLRPFLTAALVPLAAALAGCSGDPEPAPADAESGQKQEARLGDEAQAALDAIGGPANPKAEIREMLGERAIALQREDAYALRATSMGTAQQARDRRWTRWLKDAPLAEVSYAGADIDVEGAHATVRVAMAYRIKGIPEPFVSRRRLTLEDRTTWKVAKDRPMDQRAHWEVAPFTMRQSRHVVLLTAPGAPAAGLLRRLDAAHEQVSRTLPGRPLPDRILAVALRRTAQGRRLTRLYDSSVAAMDDATYLFGPAPARAVERVLSQRILIDAPFFARLPARERQSLLAHELVHAALDPSSAGRHPAWITEGLAMYLAGVDLGPGSPRAAGATAARLGGVRIADLCHPAAIARRSGIRQYDAYAISTAAVAAIVRRHGRAAMLELHDAFRDAEIPGGPCRATEAALRETVGMTVAELDAAID